MFPHSYLGAGYFGPGYFGPGIAAPEPEPSAPLVDTSLADAARAGGLGLESYKKYLPTVQWDDEQDLLDLMPIIARIL